MLYDFIKLHRWVMEIPHLNLSECVVLCVLLNAENVYGNDHGEYFLKYEEIAQMSKLSLSQAKRVVKKLEEYNMITTIRKKRMHYRIEWDRLETYMQEEQFKPSPKPVEKPIIKVKDMKEVENLNVETIEEITDLPNPEDDRYEFSLWVIDKAKEKVPRWIAMSRYHKETMMLSEISDFVSATSKQYFNGEYQKQMREVLGRRIRNAS